MKGYKLEWRNEIGPSRRPQDVQYLINGLADLDLKSMDFDLVRQIVAQIINGLIKSQKEWTLNGIFRAVRPWKPELTHINDVLSPPAWRVNSFGRLNKPGERTFYAAERSPVALWEVRAKPGEKLAIVHLEPTAEKNVSLLDLAIYETECADLVGYKNAEEIRSGYKRALGDEHRECQMAIGRFIVQQFTKEVASGNHWEYKIPAAISELLWKIPREYEAVIYPSVTRGLSGVNIALFPEFVDRNFRISGLHEIEILEISLEKVKYRTIRFASMNDQNGKIVWKDGEGNIAEVTSE